MRRGEHRSEGRRKTGSEKTGDTPVVFLEEAEGNFDASWSGNGVAFFHARCEAPLLDRSDSLFVEAIANAF